MEYAQYLAPQGAGETFHRMLAKASQDPLFEILIKAIVAGYYALPTQVSPDFNVYGGAMKDHEEPLNLRKERDKKDSEVSR